MAVRIQYSQVIDRPVDKVFKFFVVDHIRNHPRWDPDMELIQVTEGPMGVGIKIHRRNSRSGKPVDGIMEVTEYETDKLLAMNIQDGSTSMVGRTTFEAVDENHTRISILIEIPSMDASTDMSKMHEALERSGKIRKQLMESEI